MIDPLKGILRPELYRRKAPKAFLPPPQGLYLTDTSTTLGVTVNSLLLMNASGGMAQKYDLGPHRYGVYINKGVGGDAALLRYGATYFQENTASGSSNFRYLLPEVRYNNSNFAVSTIVGIDDTSGNNFQYFSSTGTIGSTGASDFYFHETSGGQSNPGRITFRTTGASGGTYITDPSYFDTSDQGFVNQHLIGNIRGTPRGGSLTDEKQDVYASGLREGNGTVNSAGGTTYRTQTWSVGCRRDNQQVRRFRGVLGIHTIHNRGLSDGEAYMLAQFPYAALLKTAGPSFPEIFDDGSGAASPGADVNFETTRVVLPTSSAGTVDATISGFGTPKAAIFIVSNGVSDDTGNGDARFSYGFADYTDVSVSERAVGFHDDNAQPTSDTNRSQTSGHSIILNNGATIICSYTSEAITDGVRLTMDDDNTAEARLCTVVLIGGDDVADVHVDHFQAGSGDTTIDVTDPGFQPNVVFMAHTGWNTAPTSAGVANVAGLIGFGAAYDDGSTIHQAGHGIGSQDGAGSTLNDSTILDGNIASQVYGGSQTWIAALQDFDADGFSWNPNSGPGSDYMFYLALRLTGDPDVSVEFHELDTSSSQTLEAGFEPTFSLINAVASNGSNTLNSSNTYYMTTAAMDENNIYSTAVHGQDNVSTTATESRSTSDLFAYSHTGGTTYRGTTAFGSTGVDITFSSAPSAITRAWTFNIAGGSGGSVDPSLTLDAGSFSLTGGELSLTADRSVNVEAGSYSVAGGSLSATANFGVSVEAGTYTVSGGALSFSATRSLGLEAGTYTVSGGSISFGSSAVLTLEGGVFAVAGGEVTPTAQRSLSAEAGAFAVTGGDFSPIAGYALRVNAGVFTTTGGDISFLTAGSASLNAGSIVVSGGGLTPTVARTMLLESGVFNATGGNLNFLAGASLQLEAGSYSITGGSLTFELGDREIILEAGSFTTVGGTVRLQLDGEVTIVWANRNSNDPIDITQISDGELVFNMYDKKMYTKDQEFNLVTVGQMYDGVGLPKSDPGVAGQFWNDDGVLKVSAG